MTQVGQSQKAPIFSTERREERGGLHRWGEVGSQIERDIPGYDFSSGGMTGEKSMRKVDVAHQEVCKLLRSEWLSLELVPKQDREGFPNT